MDLTSDPHAWLRPYYVALKADGGLQKLAIPLRFDALCCAVAGEHPSRAAANARVESRGEARHPWLA